MIKKQINRIIAVTLLLLVTSILKAGQVVETCCEHKHNPLGVQTMTPVFSWKMQSAEKGISQTAYQILVADNISDLQKNKGNMWNSGIMQTDESIGVKYQGKRLLSACNYYWKVRVWDNKKKVSKWSSINNFRMGLLRQEDWNPAKWIALEKVDKADEVYPGYQLAGNTVKYLEKEPVMPQFRKSFSVTKKIVSATAFISGLGHFELSINGAKIGDHFLDPGWSNYDKSSMYLTFDVTDNLQRGENVIGVHLGNGFLHIPRDSTRYRKLITTFSFPKMICKVRIVYADGTSEDINSNNQWKVSPSPVTFSSIYGGEDYDATKEKKGWNTPGYNDSEWSTPLELPFIGKLTSQTISPLKVMKTLKPVQIYEPKPGIYIYDFGQNASGIVSIKVKGKAGAKVVMRPAEYLTNDSLANQSNSGHPYYFSYTLKGDMVESWQPSFTYYGFRYVQVEGAVPASYANAQGLPVVDELNLLHTRNSSETVGQFHCSDSLFNNIYSLIDWSVRSNMSSVLTDCPHREKLGWLEVAHLMSSSIGYCYDIQPMYSQLIADMKNSQLDNGLIPNTAPEFANFGNDFRDSPEWGSAGIILPWFLYQWYGDQTILSESFELMEKYIRYLTSRTKENILYHGLGDWYDLGPNHPGYSQLTERGLTPTALYYYNLKVMEQTSALLGKPDKENEYRELAGQVRTAFNAKFFNKEKGYYDKGSQTANAIPLYMNIVEPQHYASAFRQIVTDIRSRDNSITAGDIGFRYLLRVLEQGNASDVIYDMNSQSSKPGYGYQLKQGATSLTESWQALHTASHNHCMLGHLLEWFYSGLGGIRADKESVAFKHFVLYPEIVGDIRNVKTCFDSPYGQIVSNWTVNGTSLEYQVTIPANTTASIHFPTSEMNDIREHNKPIARSEYIKYEKTENGRVVYLVSSGSYTFSIPHFNKTQTK